MLKKLVKYGNSNALVIDKAILELLNIGEGSVIKLSTDGTSIILTPQKIIESRKVHETYSNDKARIDNLLQQTSKFYEVPEKSLDELGKLQEKFMKLYSELGNNSNYTKEMQLLGKQIPDTTSEEFFKAARDLRDKYSPDLQGVEEKLSFYTDSYKSKVVNGKKAAPLTKKQKEMMSKDFSKTFAKHKKVFKSCSTFVNNPDYLHEVQLIAENYKENKNHEEYKEAMEKLVNKYNPESQKMRAEIKDISERYANFTEE